jgi:phage antirepressor YoqD-like protein
MAKPKLQRERNQRRREEKKERKRAAERKTRNEVMLKKPKALFHVSRFLIL